MNAPEMTPSTALVIVAHPDDAEFGCAGTVAAWVREGWEVHYVICTDASSGGPGNATEITPQARQQVSATRKAEQRAAADILGVRDVIFLDYPDGQLQPTLELRRELVRLIRRYRPARLLCQSPDRAWKPVLSIPRIHADHLAAGTAVINAMYPAAQNPWDFPELLDEGLLPHKVNELFIMLAPEINHAVDIRETLEIKLAALRAHTSQVAARFDEIAPMLRTWASENGAAFGLEAAELFHRTENP